MKYSNIILTDDNFDEELEKLCEFIGISHNNYEDFCKKLPNGFEMRQHEKGFDEFGRGEILPNKGSDFRQAFDKGQLAYEFSNGFIILGYEYVI